MSFLRGWRVGAIGALALMLAGCATDAPKSGLAPLTAGVLVERFALSGRMSIRQQDRLDTVKIEWQREGAREVMRFYSPLGGQLAELSVAADGAVLTRGETVEKAPSVTVLTSRLLGVALDTALLARWVQAIDLDNAAALAGDDRARRWSIQVEGLRAVDGMPSARVASRVDATEGDLRVRLVVDEFRVLP